MKDTNTKNNENENTTPSGLPYTPIPHIEATYKDSKDYDKGINTFAILALCFGVTAVFTVSFLGVLAIIFSVIALFQLKKYKTKGKVTAYIALILGIINLIFYILTITVLK